MQSAYERRSAISQAYPGRYIEVSPGITVEFGNAGNILGIEIPRASKVLTEKVIASLHAKQDGVL